MQNLRKNTKSFIPAFAAIALAALLILALPACAATPHDANNPYNPNMPQISFRHEHVATHEGNQIYRLVTSAWVLDGFSLLGFIVSYDNSVILPVHRETHEDIPPPTNTTIQAVTATPFSSFLSDFSAPPSAWLVRDGRTGFTYDIFTVGPGFVSYELADVFAFYFRVAGNDLSTVNATTFRLEDGRNIDSMVGVDAQASFVRPGIKIMSENNIYVWGQHHTESPVNTVIPDANISWTPFLAD